MIRAVLLALIRLYQLTLSRLILGVFGPVCRFEPSCSRYAMACIEGQGALRGSLLSVKRLCKCHPFHPGGYDPPPPPRLRPRHDVARHDDGASPAAPGPTAAPSGHPSTPGGEIPLTPH